MEKLSVLVNGNIVRPVDSSQPMTRIMQGVTLAF